MLILNLFLILYLLIEIEFFVLAIDSINSKIINIMEKIMKIMNILLKKMKKINELMKF